jgi:lipopolysaccharide export system permease protein
MMKILERYVTGSLLSSVLLAWLVLTFVLAVGLMIRVTGLLIQGLPVHLIWKYLAIGIPETLNLTIPMAVLVSTLLVFGRLSADSEIAAMRSCGINLWRIMGWPLAVGAALSLFSLFINSEVTPPNHEARRRLTAAAGFGSAMDLLEPGRFINDFQNIKIRFDSKTGHWLHNVLIYDYSRPKVIREIRAEKARIEFERDNLQIELHRVRIDPFQPDKPGAATADRMTHVIPDALKARNYRQRIKDMRFAPLLNHYRKLVRGEVPDVTEAQRPVQRSAALFELHKRLVLSCAPLCFILIGMPLGIRSHRKESTAGVATALGISFSFYILLITAESLARKPHLFLHLVIWIPVAVCVALALVLVRRNQ